MSMRGGRRIRERKGLLDIFCRGSMPYLSL
jgi:hypothetical protein